jgi:hypothetical protein
MDGSGGATMREQCQHRHCRVRRHLDHPIHAARWPTDRFDRLHRQLCKGVL